MTERQRDSLPGMFTTGTRLCLLALAVAVLVQLGVLVVRDQSAGTSGTLQRPGEQDPARIVGTYTFGWHRLRFGFRNGGPHLDPTRFTVVGRVEYLGRSLDFRSGRVRFGDADWDENGVNAIQTMVAEARSTQDSTVGVIVQLTRNIHRKYVSVPFVSAPTQGRSGSESFPHLVQEQRVVLTVTLRQVSRDDSWVILARGRVLADS